MSENRNCKVNENAPYDSMTTEELEEILRLDLNAPPGQETDTDTLLYIMGVLADRRKANGHAGNTALEAYESFKQNYLPEIEKSIDTSSAAKPKKLRLLRSLTAAVAVLAVIILGTATAKAFGLDIWEAVVAWTQETFHFDLGGQADAPDADGALAFDSLQAALDNAGIKEALVPTWIPEGYQLMDIQTESTPLQNIYCSVYQSEENVLKITVHNYLETTPEYIEQSEDFLEVYEVSGISYYLFLNNARAQAVWINGPYECYIFGNVTINELKLMIDSIEKG